MEIQSKYTEQTPEEKAYKVTKDAINSKIKQLESEQVATRKDRKQDDQSAQSFAQSKHHVNRYALRHYYAAYHQFRTDNSTYNKTLSATKETTVIDQKYIDKILSQYASKTVHINKG